LAKVTKSYEELKTLIVQEQYQSKCRKEMAMHPKEKKPKTITELGDVAENYVEAHTTDIVFGLAQGCQTSVAHSPLHVAATAVEKPDMAVLSVRGEPRRQTSIFIKDPKNTIRPVKSRLFTTADPEDTISVSKIQSTSVTSTWTSSRVFSVQSSRSSRQKLFDQAYCSCGTSVTERNG